jgi:predicted DNA-binding ribbon-helix-helix protein
MPDLVSEKKRGGKRAGSGRRKLNRRSLSARVSNALYAELQRQAEAREMTLSALVESILEQVVVCPRKEQSDQPVPAPREAVSWRAKQCFQIPNR